MTARNATILRALLACAAAGAAMPLAGCRGDRSDKPPRQFFPDMDDQPRWKPQSETPFYADGRTMRQPVANTVPFGVSTVISDAAWAEPFMTKRADFLKESPEIYEGTDELGEFVTSIPIPVNMQVLRRGQERFNIYCATCHGVNGEGANPPGNEHPEGTGSPVGRRWSIPVPTFHNPMYLPGGERGQDGYIFTVARKGVRTMPSYGHALDPHDAWAVVAYIRALQTSHLGTIQDVPEPERAGLGQPPAPPPAAPPAPTPAPTEGKQ
ncbi:MAG: cytochrome c [Phycisphaerales bacterium]|nr:cytochrome c [Phycisphaerales bacterium]